MTELSEQDRDRHTQTFIQLVNEFGLLNTLEGLALLCEYLAVGSTHFEGDPQWFEIAALISGCHGKASQTIARNHFLKEKNK